MRRKMGIIFASSLAVAVLLNTSSVYASDVEAGMKQEVIVVYKNQQGKETILDESVKVDYAFDTIPAVSATVTNADLRQLLNDPNIAYVEQNVTFRTAGGTVNAAAVPAEQSQWNFQAIQPTKLWAEGYTGKGVKVAVMDSGIFPHSELSVAGGVSVLDYTTNYTDDDGHGTHVAGIIAANHDGKGMVGIAPDVELYAVKVVDGKGEGNLGTLLKGIEWAIQNEMDIINISLGSETDSELLHEAIDRAYDAGILLVGVAGNSQKDKNGNLIPVSTYTTDYPGKYDSVIAVGAIDNANARWDASSVGPEVEFAAPGADVVSTYIKADGTGGYGKASGTSEAAPHVSAMLALLKQKYPSMTNKQLREELKKYAVDLGAPGRDVEFGYGAVSFNKDIDPPANATNIQFVSKTENSISIAWTNPTDSDFTTNNIYANNVKIGTTAAEEFTLENLQPNTSYTIAVKSVDAGGNESSGATIVETTNADATAPAEVGNLAVVQKSTTSVRVSWTNPSDSDFKRVNLFLDGTPVGNVAGTEYEFTGLNPNTEYLIEAKTEDTNGNVSAGQSISVTTEEEAPVVDTTPPDEVRNLEAGAVTTTTAEITWNNPWDTDFEKVNLYQDDRFVADASGTRYVFTGLDPDTRYTFTAKTVDRSGNESVGESISVRTEQDQIPVIPADVENLQEIFVSEDTIEIEWDFPRDPDIDHFKVYLDDNFVESVTRNVYEATRLSPNTTYRFTIRAANRAGTLSDGRSISLTTKGRLTPPVDIYPEEVTDLRMDKKTENSVEVSWIHPNDPDFDRVYAYVDGVKVGETTKPWYTFENLQSDTAYVLTIKAVDFDGNVSRGEELRVRTDSGGVIQPPIDPIDPKPPVDTTPPGDVSDLEVAVATNRSLRVRWIHPIDSDFAGAKVYVDGRYISKTMDSFMDFSNLEEDREYTILVIAVDSSGNESGGRTIVARTKVTDTTNPPTYPPIDPNPPVADTTAPAEVSGLEIVQTMPTSLQVQWINPTDADFKNSKLFINGIASQETAGTSYEFSGLVADTEYTIIIKTVDESGNVSLGKNLVAKTLVAPIVTPPPNPTTPTIPGEDIIDVPTNPGNSGGRDRDRDRDRNQSSAQTTVPASTTTVDGAKTALDQAKKSLTITSFVDAKSAIQGLTDVQKRSEFEVELNNLKQALKINDLPTKSLTRNSIPVGISLEVAMKSVNYKYVDEASIRPGENIFVLNSRGELIEDVEVKVMFNRIVVAPKNDAVFASNEAYTIIIDTSVKGKVNKDSTESFELRNPLMLEFITR
ncbi:S8 family serine peptidase [Paenibacillus massiliensis]|uniref:S8 family serine peptidase n=1 Tax=Paenibacillus massiliensis TaxID=225917 RepID=UPI00046E5F81|nr:S8 family serine peptidase [Paenibacillus massiliensis]